MSNFSNKFPQFIGFDSIFNAMDSMLEPVKKAQSNWPPYNVIKNDDGSYAIELAVAGFGKADIDVTVEGNKMTVRGNSSSSDSNYIYKGIADRSFERTFTLADSVVVKSGEVVNGMLKIMLDAQAEVSKAIRVAIK